MYKTIFAISFLLTASFSKAQKPHQPDAAEIYAKILKLNILGTALYVAAHPDDENQRLISYLANKKGFHTTYLSLTRGDGGQNEIGTEIRDELGVIRTQELLQARKIDGGHQRFSRAIDFGYSKHPDETFAIWNKKEVLGDVVYTIRELQPDVIITRFDHRSPGSTHGHHTGSAMLGYEAFGLSGDESAYPEQLSVVSPWQASAVFMNTHPWFYGGQEKFDKADKTNLYTVDIGVYYPLLGQSNTEISQAARSMHKCQGFGATGYRGSKEEWLEYLSGSRPENKADVFEGINTTWTRIDGGDKIAPVIDDIIENFTINDPAQSLSKLILAYQSIDKLEDSIWKKRKKEDITEIIGDCIGLYAEAKSNSYSAVPGDSVHINIEAINRSNIGVHLNEVSFLNNSWDVNQPLKDNIKFEKEIKLSSSKEEAYTSPFWLGRNQTLGSYDVPSQKMRNNPEQAGPTVQFDISILEQHMVLNRPVIYKWNDAVDGERYRPFEWTPPVSVALNDDVYIFKYDETKTLTVRVKSWTDAFDGYLELKTPTGWKVSPSRHDVHLSQKEESVDFTFQVAHDINAAQGQLEVRLQDKNDLSSTYSDHIQVIEYDHIPTQTVVKKAAAQIIAVDFKKEGNLVGYIEGAGDKIPEALQVMGYQVEMIDIASASLHQLKKYDVIMTGIRAFNTESSLKYKNQVLFDYAEQGGTVIVQYNKSRGLQTKDIAPYPIKLSRKRVTDEFAEVRFVNPNHEVLNYPNKMNPSDFDGWVQERGLYFPEEWDDHFSPILSMNDAGEEPLEGSLLVARHGSGYYVHTSISFFRELPAGVTGSYRLLANLLSIGKKNN